MAGLLYKDFVITCRMKKTNLVWLIIIATILFGALRIFTSDLVSDPDFLLLDENGKGAGSLIDLTFLMFTTAFMTMCMSWINLFVTKITESDDKNKIKGYLQVMPIGKYDYIASKYIFIGIVCYVLLSFEMVWTMFCIEYGMEGILAELATMLQSLVLSLTCVSLFIAAIELPLFLYWGKEKATLVKVSIGMGIAFVVIGYVLFGDLSIFENMDLFHIMDWVKAHETEITVVNVISPILVIALYYLSYRISCKLMDQKEV